MGKFNKFSRPFQVHVVAAICRVPHVMDRLKVFLDEEDLFDDPKLMEVAKFAAEVYGESRELPSHVSIAEALGDGEVIDEIWAEDISDPAFVIENIVDFARQQAVERAVEEAAERIDRGEHDGIVEIVRKALETGEDFGDLGEFFHDSFDARVEDYTNPAQVHRVRTGLTHLDKCMGGGLEAGELGVFLAPPKAGKSFTLVNVGVGAARGADGCNVVHYSCEMKARKICRRYDMRVAGAKTNILLEENPKEFISRLRKRKKKLVGGEILVKGYRTRSASVETLRSHLSHVKSYGYNFGAVIVDYGDILKASRRLGELRHEQAGIYEDLRGLGQEFGVPVWTASQANRGSLNKDIVTMADVAESFEKIAIADAVVAICRTEEERNTDAGRLFLAALREQPMGKIIDCIFALQHSLVKTVAINDDTVSSKTKSKKKNRTPDERKKEGEEKRGRAAARRMSRKVSESEEEE